MRSFAKFCESITAPNIPDITGDTPVSVKEQDIISHVSNDIRRRVNILDRINIPYVEGSINSAEDVAAKLIANENTDIPEGILNQFAKSIYGKAFNSLTQSERSIIVVLSVYILI